MGKTKTTFIGEDSQNRKDIRTPGLKGGERVVSIGGDILIDNIKNETKDDKKTSSRRRRIRGKKYKDLRTKIDRQKLYPVNDAVKLVKATSYSRFNGSVELHLVVRKTGISADVDLPHGTGKEKKVEVADDKTVEKLKKGKIDFDVLLATPEMMPKIVPFARILGPKGLMPNPKNKTLIKTVADAKKFSVNTLAIKTEKKAPIIHTVVGKLDQNDEALIENIEAIIEGINIRQITKAYLCSTMSPSVKLDIN